ncbi:MAG: gspF, partial [Ilumatobacteraceae bacterium]|nr:gspF [Ilumatobacteraceae bacterium]
AAAVALVAGRFAPRPPRLRPVPKATRRGRSVRRLLLPSALAVVTFTVGPLAAAVGIVGVLVRQRLSVIRGRRREQSAIATAFPDFVDVLVLTITAGCSTTQAIDIVGDIVPHALRPAIKGVAHRTRLGGRFADAIAELQLEPPMGLGPIAQPLADALALADRYGTPLAPVLDRLAEEARNQRRRNAEAAARQLPVRLAFPLVGCTLPSFVLLTVVPLMAGTFSSLRGLSP